MSEEYENKTGFEEGSSSDGSYSGRYTDGDNAERSYAYKTVMDGVPRSRGWSVASMVLGILSVLCCCISCAHLGSFTFSRKIVRAIIIIAPTIAYTPV